MKIKNISNWSILLVGVLLCFVPFVTNETGLLIMMTNIFIFAIFAMSYDLLLGFTGIVSFGHAMFFGLGAYSTAIFMKRVEPTMEWFFISVLVGIVLSLIVSIIVGVLTLRLKSHFYAMLTLAVASLFLVVAEKWRHLTVGNDGFTFRVPDVLKDRPTFYIICLVLMIGIFFLLKRFINSPLGRVLMAIRENENRVESLGFVPLYYKVTATVVAGVTASLAGSLFTVVLRYINTSVFTMDITLNALLMTIIGGVGTLIGPMIGAGLIEFAQEWITELADVHPIFERWIIFFGILYILAVIFFPTGIVGTVNKWIAKAKSKRIEKLTPKDEKMAG